MLESIFRFVMNISIAASVVALIVYIIRLTIGRYISKKFSYYLWILVLIKLIIPIDFSSSLSIFNYIPTTTKVIGKVTNPNIEIKNIPNIANPNIGNNINPPVTNTSQSLINNSSIDVLISMLSILWIIGTIFLIIQGIIKYYKVSKALETSTIIEDNSIEVLKKIINLKRNIKVYAFDGIKSPLVYGLIKPKIVIPTSMVEQIHREETKHILTHELIHIKRFDNIFKFIWSMAIYIHWFNPLVWLSAKKFTEDMELSCDEEVMKIWNKDIRKDYAESLINIADKQNFSFQEDFIGFGETNIKTRIKNIMKYKKPKTFTTLVGIVLLVFAVIVTLTNKKEQIVHIDENFGLKTSMEDRKLNDKLKLAYEGLIDDVEFSINTSAEDIIHKWGEPRGRGFMRDGGLFLSYDDIIFHTNGHLNSDNGYNIYNYGDIVGIIVKESYGIKFGMDIDDVKDILGKPHGETVYDSMRRDGEGIVKPKLYYYVGDYTVTIPYDEKTKEVLYIKLGSYRDYPDITRKGFLELNNLEKEVYESYIIDFDENKLRGLGPISIMKMYLHAGKEKNYEGEWELYIKEENYVVWDKEYHMSIPKDDRTKDFSQYENPVNIRVDYRDFELLEAVVSWEDKYADPDSYDGHGNPFRYPFSLIRNSNGIWKVQFLPIQ